MLIRSKKPSDVASSEITPEAVYRSRREFMRVAAAGAVGAVAGSYLSGQDGELMAAQAALQAGRNSKYVAAEPPNTFEEVTNFNNYYEFGINKSDPAQYAHTLTTKPWTVRVDGHCAKPADYAYEDLVKPHQLEERIYRLRCVERWAAVVPWVGFPLRDLIARFEPTSRAKYVAFTTIQRPEEMRLGRSLDWPYVEGLRMDEALHPLTLVAVGLYGKELLNQNGAPIRLVVPWKYGFKSIKSIVRIEFVEEQPPTSWNVANAREYGFYSNVNPEVDHPRWSQRRERRLGELLMNRPTQLFNGYGDEVASLYAGMDLKKFY
jgi:sulfoxide reductase catalytic subunit YedY